MTFNQIFYLSCNNSYRLSRVSQTVHVLGIHQISHILLQTFINLFGLFSRNLNFIKALMFGKEISEAKNKKTFRKNLLTLFRIFRTLLQGTLQDCSQPTLDQYLFSRPWGSLAKSFTEKQFVKKLPWPWHVQVQSPFSIRFSLCRICTCH